MSLYAIFAPCFCCPFIPAIRSFRLASLDLLPESILYPKWLMNENPLNRMLVMKIIREGKGESSNCVRSLPEDLVHLCQAPGHIGTLRRLSPIPPPPRASLAVIPKFYPLLCDFSVSCSRPSFETGESSTFCLGDHYAQYLLKPVPVVLRRVVRVIIFTEGRLILRQSARSIQKVCGRLLEVFCHS